MKQFIKRNLGAFLVISVIAIVFLSFLIGPTISQINDYVRITDLDYTAVVIDEQPGDNGKVRITERLTFDVHAASRSNGMWELWRDLPEEYVDGVLVEYKVLSVKRLSVNGNSAAYKEFTEASKLYDRDSDYISSKTGLGPDKWFHSKGPYDGEENFECVLFYVNDLYRETTVFEIEYEMYNASMRYGDCSELYLSLFSGKDIKYLNSVNGKILVPENKMPAQNNYTAGTYGTKSHTFPFTESTKIIDEQDYHAFEFSLNKADLSFKPYNRYIEFSLVSFGEDKHKFTEFAKKNDYYNTNVHEEIIQVQADYDALPAKNKQFKFIVLAALCALTVLVLVTAYFAKRKAKRKHPFFKPTQDFEFYRDIPAPLDATLAGALAFCKHKLSDDVPGSYAAAMLGLARKRYIDADRINPRGSWNPENIQIKLNRNFASAEGKLLLEPLTPTEEAYFILLRRHAKDNWEIALNRFQTAVENDYQYTETFVKNIKNVVKPAGMSAGLFQEPEYKKVKKAAVGGLLWRVALGVIALLVNFFLFSTRLDLAFGAFFILGAGLIGSGILYWIRSQELVLLTQFGEDEYAKWRGLYRFLNSETLMREREVPELAIWEEYLIYATAFGIPEKVLKALEMKFPDFATTTASPVLRNPYFRTRVFIFGYNRSFRYAVRRAVHTSRSGTHGRGGFGGGYGGGGRGGGGGGGGH